MSINISNGLKSKILFSILMLSLVLLPLASFAAIPIPNPGGMFSNVDLITIVKNAINFIIAFVGILGIIFIIWGSIQYVLSAGDEGKTEEAKTIITYAALGLFIAALAYAIEDLVLTRLLA